MTGRSAIHTVRPGSQRLTRPVWTAAALAAILAPGCKRAQPAALAQDGRPTPVYDTQTGRLKELISDRNGDGKADVHAFMDGLQFQRIEVDRNADGVPDRWEYYDAARPGDAAGAPPVLGRAEEANGKDSRVTRREFYTRGVLARVEDDTDNDGRADKWETYTDGVLVRLDLDTTGKGVADRRLVYGPSGNLDHMEQDLQGNGDFRRLTPTDPKKP